MSSIPTRRNLGVIGEKRDDPCPRAPELEIPQVCTKARSGIGRPSAETRSTATADSTPSVKTSQSTAIGPTVGCSMILWSSRWAPTTPDAHSSAKRGVAPVQCLDQSQEAFVVREAAGGPAQVGDDRGLRRVAGERGHWPLRQPRLLVAGREGVAGEVAQRQWCRRGVTEQGCPAAVPPDQLPVGGEYRDGGVTEPVEHAVHAGRDVVGDLAVRRSGESGEPVKVVAFGGSEL